MVKSSWPDHSKYSSLQPNISKPTNIPKRNVTMQHQRCLSVKTAAQDCKKIQARWKVEKTKHCSFCGRVSPQRLKDSLVLPGSKGWNPVHVLFTNKRIKQIISCTFLFGEQFSIIQKPLVALVSRIWIIRGLLISRY